MADEDPMQRFYRTYVVRSRPDPATAPFHNRLEARLYLLSFFGVSLGFSAIVVSYWVGALSGSVSGVEIAWLIVFFAIMTWKRHDLYLAALRVDRWPERLRPAFYLFPVMGVLWVGTWLAHNL